MTGEEKRIKTALEIALERAQKIRVSPEELEKINYVSEGKKIAGKYLKEEDFDLRKIFKEYQEKIKEYVREGAQSLLQMKLTLPRNEKIKKENKKVLKGILILGKDKKKTEKICKRIETLFNTYEKERGKEYEKTKAEVELHLREAKETLEELGFNIEIENQPEFKKRWTEVSEILDSNYGKLLEEYIRGLDS